MMEEITKLLVGLHREASIAWCHIRLIANDISNETFALFHQYFVDTVVTISCFHSQTKQKLSSLNV